MGFPETCQLWDEVFFFKHDSKNDMGTIKNQTVKFHPEVVITTAPRCRETSPRRFLPKPLACGPRLGGKE